MMEIEIKYHVPDRRIFTELLRLKHIDRFTLLPHATVERQRTTYFDTPDGRLAAQRCGLRVRESAGRRIATVKRSLGTADGLHTREEWETPIGAQRHPYDWPESAARTQALILLGDAPLIVCCRVETRRQQIAALLAETQVAELSLDEGSISAAGRVLGFRELEIELAHATHLDAFHTLVAALRKRFTLLPENRGRRTRGVMLWRRTEEQLLERAAEA